LTGRRDRDLAELLALRAVRSDMRALLSAGRDVAVGLTNQALAEAKALPQLMRHDDLDWHIHAIDPNARLVRRVKVETAMAMIDLICADELSRLSTCASDGCEGLVFDLSRNRSRRFCSTRCSNRSAAAAYRGRKRGPPANRQSAPGG